MDSRGNIWMAFFRGDARVGEFDPASTKFVEYRVPTQPGRIRRASVDLDDRVWYGIYDRGIIGYVDPKTDNFTEIKLPLDISRPYDPQGDYEGNVWFGDDGQGGATIRYNPRTREFTLLPDAAGGGPAEDRDHARRRGLVLPALRRRARRRRALSGCHAG